MSEQPTATDTHLPPCCYAPIAAELAHRLYAAYNRGGDRPGLNYRNEPCPLWGDLPEDVQAKWRAVAEELRRVPSEL